MITILMKSPFEYVCKLPPGKKNTIRDGGSTALHTAYNVYNVYTLSTVSTV